MPGSSRFAHWGLGRWRDTQGGLHGAHLWWWGPGGPRLDPWLLLVLLMLKLLGQLQVTKTHRALWLL